MEPYGGFPNAWIDVLDSEIHHFFSYVTLTFYLLLMYGNLYNRSNRLRHRSLPLGLADRRQQAIDQRCLRGILLQWHIFSGSRPQRLRRLSGIITRIVISIGLLFLLLFFIHFIHFRLTQQKPLKLRQKYHRQRPEAVGRPA